MNNININNNDNEVIIKAIIAMAHALKLDIISEGLEMQKQLDFLKSKHHKEIQGCTFCKPISSKELENTLKKSVIQRE